MCDMDGSEGEKGVRDKGVEVVRALSDPSNSTIVPDPAVLRQRKLPLPRAAGQGPESLCFK